MVLAFTCLDEKYVRIWLTQGPKRRMAKIAIKGPRMALVHEGERHKIPTRKSLP